MAIGVALTSVTALSVWGISESEAAREKAAVQTVEDLERWLKREILEGIRLGESFTLHLPAVYSDRISLTWDRTGKKDCFYTDGNAYLVNYAYKGVDVYLMPQWCRMSEGFTIKFNMSGKPSEAGFKFLIVSPEARVHLSHRAPKH